MQANLYAQPEIAVSPKSSLFDRLFYIVPIGLLGSCLIFMYFTGKLTFSATGILQNLNQDFLIYLLVGILAQLVDGSLGMGYGATSTSLLMSIGISPVVSSASVHLSEMFSSGASAISHHRFGNINKKLFKNLLIPGVIGSAVGAYLLADVIDGKLIKPYVAAYMIILGSVIIQKALKKNIVKKKTKNLGVLATFGGFMDAVGGGGWGPIVTSTLLSRGRNPRYTVGSVNAAEFAVAFASGITFMLFEGVNSWQVASGLIIGGLLVAPLGAYLANRIPRKPFMVAVGVLIIILSLRTLLAVFK